MVFRTEFILGDKKKLKVIKRLYVGRLDTKAPKVIVPKKAYKRKSKHKKDWDED